MRCVQFSLDYKLCLLYRETIIKATNLSKNQTLASKIGRHPWPSAKTHNNYLIALRNNYWKPSLIRIGIRIRMRRAYNTRHTYCTVALMHGVKILLEKYARWIPGTDGGRERRLLEQAMQDSSPHRPQVQITNSQTIDNSLNINEENDLRIGRHDWTRTNDPYHVKVVL
jgi:hypothetical protein